MAPALVERNPASVVHAITEQTQLITKQLSTKETQSMTAWTSDELARIGTADELDIAPLRPGGTLRNPVTIWVVRHGDDLYVRSYRGPGGAWFRAVQERHQGRIQSGGVDKAVTFAAETDAAVNDQIDAAYRAKYRGYSAAYVDPMVTPAARATTLKIVPRD